MPTAASLNGGLLVGADDELAWTQRHPVEHPLVQVEHSAGLGGEVGVAGEDPGVMLPGLERISVQPAPQRRRRDRLDQPGGDDLLAQLAKAPAAERHAVDGWQLAGQRLDLGDHHVGEGLRPPRAGQVPKPCQAPLAPAPPPLAHRGRPHPKPAGDVLGGQPRRSLKHDPGA